MFNLVSKPISIEEKAAHFAKVACMVKDHMKVAEGPSAAILGGLGGAAAGGVGNLLFRNYLEKNKKVKPTSPINNLLLGALGGGALGSGAGYLLQHGLTPDLNQTIKSPDGLRETTLAKLQLAGDNSNNLEGSEAGKLVGSIAGARPEGILGHLGTVAKSLGFGAIAGQIGPKRERLWNNWKQQKLGVPLADKNWSTAETLNTGLLSKNQPALADNQIKDYVSKVNAMNELGKKFDPSQFKGTKGADQIFRAGTSDVYDSSGAKVTLNNPLPMASTVYRSAAGDALKNNLARSAIYGQLPRTASNVWDLFRNMTN